MKRLINLLKCSASGLSLFDERLFVDNFEWRIYSGINFFSIGWHDTRLEPITIFYQAKESNYEKSDSSIPSMSMISEKVVHANPLIAYCCNITQGQIVTEKLIATKYTSHTIYTTDESFDPWGGSFPYKVAHHIKIPSEFTKVEDIKHTVNVEEAVLKFEHNYPIILEKVRNQKKLNDDFLKMTNDRFKIYN